MEFNILVFFLFVRTSKAGSKLSPPPDHAPVGGPAHNLFMILLETRIGIDYYERS